MTPVDKQKISYQYALEKENHFMRTLTIASILLVVCCLGSFAADKEEVKWELAKDKQGVKVYTRKVDGIDFKECKGVITIKTSLTSLVALVSDANAAPDMVQIGNEIIQGMLWPDGKLPQNWDNLADLLRAGIKGVDAGRGNTRRPLIMIHIDKGGNLEATKWFFDRWHSYGIDYDVIGQSYYPWWHGSLLDLRENFNFMANTYDKDIILVEVAYNCERAEYRNRPAPFPETPEGQQQFLDEVHRIVLNTPHNRGKGIFWWEPATRRGGRRTLFDREGNALPAITVFDKFTRH